METFKTWICVCLKRANRKMHAERKGKMKRIRIAHQMRMKDKRSIKVHVQIITGYHRKPVNYASLNHNGKKTNLQCMVNIWFFGLSLNIIYAFCSMHEATAKMDNNLKTHNGRSNNRNCILNICRILSERWRSQFESSVASSQQIDK